MSTRDRWFQHDIRRPKAPVVAPVDSLAQRPAPKDAVILFDGSNLDAWRSPDGGPARWKVTGGAMEVAPGTGAIETKAKFGDVQLHVEWASPNPPVGTGQDRGNSGIFLMGLFEIQVLDSFRNPTYADGQAGAIYGQWPPLVNAMRKPGVWQTYDIVFEAPEFISGRRTKSAYMTVFLNGVLLHNHKEAMGPTVFRKVARYVPGPPEGPIILQDHGAAVRYRNIWVRRLGGYDQPEK